MTGRFQPREESGLVGFHREVVDGALSALANLMAGERDGMRTLIIRGALRIKEVPDCSRSEPNIAGSAARARLLANSPPGRRSTRGQESNRSRSYVLFLGAQSFANIRLVEFHLRQT